VLLAFEPHTGLRSVQVRARRTAIEYAQFFQELVRRHYRAAEQSRLVQDTVNTHPPGAWSHVVPPAEALQVAPQVALHDTPNKGRWVHRAESACAALATHCRDRRIPARDTVATETLAWAHKRHTARKPVHWQFTQTGAREKLKSKYPMLTD